MLRGKKSTPSRGAFATVAHTSTTVSPQRTRALPPACSAYLPVITDRVRPASSIEKLPCMCFSFFLIYQSSLSLVLYNMIRKKARLFLPFPSGFPRVASVFHRQLWSLDWLPVQMSIIIHRPALQCRYQAVEKVACATFSRFS